MSKLFTAALAAVVSLAFASAASAATVPVTSLTGPFSATNSTVHSTPEGVHFGTYADGGALGGTMFYTGFNGHKLSDLTDFSYTFTYRQAGNTTGAAPYLRVFLDTDADGNVDNDVILDPSFCATTTPAQSTDLTYQMVGNSVRYSDDGCDGVAPDQQPWATVVADHGDEEIIGLLVSQGNSTGTDVSALLRNITVNGTTYAFNVPPAQGPQGPAGPAGPAGNNGAAGPQGVAGRNGVNGAPGTTQIIERVVTVPAAPSVCATGTKRTLHASSRKGAKFLSAKATLRGKKLTVKGRTVTVNLAGQTEGNFNVKITARYRSNKTHKVFTRTEVRNLSVACP